LNVPESPIVSWIELARVECLMVEDRYEIHKVVVLRGVKCVYLGHIFGSWL
jgi:hypothetical protein